MEYTLRFSTDEACYLAYLNGQDAGLEQLMEQYGTKLTLYLNGYLHDMQEAEDLMIDVFAYLLVKKPKIREGGFKAYIYKAARHKALRAKQRRKPTFSLDDEMLGEPVSQARVDQTAEANERARILRACVEQLSPDYREAVYLTYFENLSYEQAAAVMGKNVKQITNLVYRGKQSLRGFLAKEGITDAQ